METQTTIEPFRLPDLQSTNDWMNEVRENIKRREQAVIDANVAAAAARRSRSNYAIRHSCNSLSFIRRTGDCHACLLYREQLVKCLQRQTRLRKGQLAVKRNARIMAAMSPKNAGKYQMRFGQVSFGNILHRFVTFSIW